MIYFWDVLTNKIKNKTMISFRSYYFGKKSYKKRLIGIGNGMLGR